VTADATNASGSSPGRIAFYTTPAGTTSLQEQMQINSAGAIEFPNVLTTASAGNAFLNSTNRNNLLRSTSSIRYKRDIQPVQYDDARRVLELTPVSFHSKSPADDPKREFEGLTAEQGSQYLPQFVNYIKDNKGNETPDGVQYDRIAAVALLSVVKEQQKEIEALKSCRLWCMIKEEAGY
jgi:hypothetical protein